MDAFSPTGPMSADEFNMSAVHDGLRSLGSVLGARGPHKTSGPHEAGPSPSGSSNGPNAFSKVQICFDFCKGHCRRGAGCKFSHDMGSIIAINCQEGRICYDFVRGQCLRGALCRYSHDTAVLATHNLVKSQSGAEHDPSQPHICFEFLQGTCDRGDSCRYSHNVNVARSDGRRTSSYAPGPAGAPMHHDFRMVLAAQLAAQSAVTREGGRQVRSDSGLPQIPPGLLRHFVRPGHGAPAPPQHHSAPAGAPYGDVGLAQLQEEQARWMQEQMWLRQLLVAGDAAATPRASEVPAPAGPVSLADLLSHDGAQQGYPGAPAPQQQSYGAPLPPQFYSLPEQCLAPAGRQDALSEYLAAALRDPSVADAVGALGRADAAAAQQQAAAQHATRSAMEPAGHTAQVVSGRSLIAGGGPPSWHTSALSTDSTQQGPAST
ncbi:unnamed protein product [Pedinophyceae sp. YPF-701]|nr:unnamed protein product [Pedinophyceae sp. YPF-701]